MNVSCKFAIIRHSEAPVNQAVGLDLELFRATRFSSSWPSLLALRAIVLCIRQPPSYIQHIFHAQRLGLALLHQHPLGLFQEGIFVGLHNAFRQDPNPLSLRPFARGPKGVTRAVGNHQLERVRCSIQGCVVNGRFKQEGPRETQAAVFGIAVLQRSGAIICIVLLLLLLLLLLMMLLLPIIVLLLLGNVVVLERVLGGDEALLRWCIPPPREITRAVDVTP
mmetsp:Transcript_26908/g.74169  ORF Transcript_26908/g.74169 Transcript_26908/m.74169 type:complete len:222 (+) Transcript_26908:599-1264(+)